MKRNSFIRSFLEEKENMDAFKQKALHELGNISNMYIYTNMPPQVYGSPLKLILDSISRAHDFSEGDGGGSLKITLLGLSTNSQMYIGEEKDFPYEKTTGRFLRGEVQHRARQLLKTKFVEIKESVSKSIREMITTDVTVLNKGRMTWCPFWQRSVSAPQALVTFIENMERNLGQRPFSLLGFIFMTSKMLEKEELWLDTLVERKEYIDKKRKYVTKKEVLPMLYVGEKAIAKWMEVLTSFCGYGKGGERGKGESERRAISSPNMGMRAFLYLSERFHLHFSKNKDCDSTIGIGGILKVSRISKLLNSLKEDLEPSKALFWATEDATKWNECIPPEGMALMMDILLDEEEWQKVPELVGQSLPEMAVLKMICCTTHVLQAFKRIYIKKGPKVYDGLDEFTVDVSDKTQWQSLSTPIQEMLLKVEENCKGDYLECHGGMLMGMSNAASTTYGLLSSLAPHEEIFVSKKRTVRSSDDSMTAFMCKPGDIQKAEALDTLILKRLGINKSVEKTIVLPFGIGEYTSIYFHNERKQQVGTELSALRPGGENPVSDIFQIGKNLNMLQKNQTLEGIAALVYWMIGVSNVRRLYKIKPNEDPSIPLRYRLIADGGLNLQTNYASNLEEVEFKKRIAENENALDEKLSNYYYMIRSPISPFNTRTSMEPIFDKELGETVIDDFSILPNVFKYSLRSNRTLGEQMIQIRRRHYEQNAGILQLMKALDPIKEVQDFSSLRKVNKELALCLAFSMGRHGNEVDSDIKEALRILN